MRYYVRHISQVVLRQQKRKKVIILTGARQVGKFTMLTKLLLDVPYVTLDDPLLRLQAIEDAGAFIAQNRPPIIIDEIQKAPLLFDYIKMMVDKDGAGGQYYLTGFHAFSLMNGVKESLAGRAGVVKMLGLSLREMAFVNTVAPFVPTVQHIEKMTQEKVSFNYNNVITKIHLGSYPKLHAYDTDLKDWRDYYSGYMQSYLEKDVGEYIKTDNISAFIKFIRAVAAISGEQLNTTYLAEISGMSVNTIRSWLGILEKSGHIYLLQPYSNNLNKRLVKTPKLYFLDTGFLCFLSGWNTPEQLVNGARWGHIFETFVVGEILKSYYNDGIIYPPLYYYRDKDKVEVDLLIEDGETLYPVEIKATTQPNKSMIKNFDTALTRLKKPNAQGALICLYENKLLLNENAISIPPTLI